MYNIMCLKLLKVCNIDDLKKKIYQYTEFGIKTGFKNYAYKNIITSLVFMAINFCEFSTSFSFEDI